MENNGYIKLHRKSLESVVFENPNTWKVWCYCMLRANHKKTMVQFEGEEIILNPGQFITGRYHGAEGCKMKPSTFNDQIRKLKKLKNLNTKSDNKKTIITIVNWVFYQCNGETPGINSDNDPTTTQHRQECKNDNNVKNMYGQWFESFWDNFPKKVNKKKAELIFHKVCKDDETFQKINSALSSQKLSEQWNKNNGQFIPHPSTWLNGERWNDQLNIKGQNEISKQNNQRNESSTGSDAMQERWSDDNLAKSKYHKQSTCVC
jgi:hypothetical protein